MKRINIITAIILLTGSFWLGGCAKETASPVTPSRDAFIGTWIAAPTKATYEVVITADPNSTNGVFLANFAEIGFSYPPASASVDGNTITLDANQVIGSDLTVKGSGVMTGTKIKWNYTTFDGADLKTIAETYTKQ